MLEIILSLQKHLTATDESTLEEGVSAPRRSERTAARILFTNKVCWKKTFKLPHNKISKQTKRLTHPTHKSCECIKYTSANHQPFLTWLVENGKETLNSNRILTNISAQIMHKFWAQKVPCHI